MRNSEVGKTICSILIMGGQDMRIGIVTPYDAANYGAYLQAYASKRYLESQGHEVFMIRWRKEEERKDTFLKKANSLVDIVRLIATYPHERKKYSVMTEALEEFNIISVEEIDKYSLDLITIGSDIVWNISVNEFQKPIFYGKGLPIEIVRCAYAPSVGNCEIDDFNNFPEQREGLKKIEIIGVRDENTASIIENITGICPQLVCDPTLLIDIGDYQVANKTVVKGKYLLVYSYYVPQKYREYLIRYARENKLKLVAACMYQRWCDMNIVCSPLDFCTLIEHAECVFTTTFHGSIFTLLNHKRCVIFAKLKKVVDLLQWTNMECVKIDEDTRYEQFEKLLSYQPDYTKFEKELEQRRKKSRDLYETALKGVQHRKNI